MKTIYRLLIIIIICIPVKKGLSQEEEYSDTLSIDKGPGEEIRVNKELDENGNIIYYDSVYSRSWSGNETDDHDFDSIFRYSHHPFMFDFNVDPFFYTPYNHMHDSSFFYNDPFDMFFNQHMIDIQELMEQHQRMMEQFFEDMPSFEDFEEFMKPYTSPPKDSTEIKDKMKHKQEKAKPRNQVFM